MKNQLTDLTESVFTFEEVELEEGKPKAFRASGPLLDTSKPTLNRRHYKTEIIAGKALPRFIEQYVEKASAYLYDGHPEPGYTPKPSDVTARLTKAWMDGSTVMGEMIIPDTSVGRDVQALIKSGGSVGISLRGSGTLTAPTTEGIQYIKDDFVLHGFDMVLNPASVGAGIKTYKYEHREGGDTMTKEQLLKEHPELVKAIREDVEKEMHDKFEKMKEEIAEEIAAELAAKAEEEEAEGVKKELETCSTELKTTKEALEKAQADIATLTEAKTALEKAQADALAEKVKAEVNAFVTESLKDSPYAETVKGRIGTPATVEEAKTLIESELTYIEQLKLGKPAETGTKNVPGKKGDITLEHQLRLAGVTPKK